MNLKINDVPLVFCAFSDDQNVEHDMNRLEDGTRREDFFTGTENWKWHEVCDPAGVTLLVVSGASACTVGQSNGWTWI